MTHRTISSLPTRAALVAASIFFTSASRGAIVQASARQLESGSSATKVKAVPTGASEVPPVTTTATGSAATLNS